MWKTNRPIPYARSSDDFCKRVRELIGGVCRQNGLSHGALGGLLGVTRQAVCQWANGTCKPTGERYLVLEQLYNAELVVVRWPNGDMSIEVPQS